MFTHPELLAHPNIPAPLHGLNPRTLKGDAWWDIQRHQAYQKNDYHCWACGIHKQDAKYHQWLEGHESYQVDYKHGKVYLVEIVALCHSCHNFIHSGKLRADYKGGKISYARANDILEHGLNACYANGIEPFVTAVSFYAELQGSTERVSDLLGWRPESGEVRWQDWRLVLDGVEYKPLYKTRAEWERHYTVTS